MSSLMAIGVANANGQSTDVSAALGFSFNRIKLIFLLAVLMIFKLLVAIAPFLLAAGAVVFFLITDYDINYYLAVQPAEFWMAAVIIGIIIFLMAILLIRRLISWSLTLPLVLFVGTQPAKSVVNKYGQSHDVKNLFIVDSSVFVTSGGVNPASTLQALALYITDHIKKEKLNLIK